MATEQLSRVQKKGQVTIPAEIRQRWDLKEGDLVSFSETDDGVLISPQQMMATQTLNQISKLLKDHGIDLTSVLRSAEKEKAEAGSTPNGPGVVAFLQHVQSEAVDPTNIDMALSIIDETFGTFQAEQPADFNAMREDFIDHLATDR